MTFSKSVLVRIIYISSIHFKIAGDFIAEAHIVIKSFLFITAL